MTVRVATAVGHAWEADLVTRLESAVGVAVVRRCADVADLLAAGSAGLADVAVLSADLRALDRDSLDHLRAHGVRVVGIGPPGDEEAERRLRQMGVGCVLRADAAAEDLAAALTAPARQAPSAPDDRPADLAADASEDGAEPGTDEDVAGSAGRVVAVWGPTGAPGRTTVAVNVAAEVAAAGVPTLLVDADTYGASVAQALALLDEAPGVAAAARAGELGTLDLAHLARLAPEVARDLRVLTGLPTADRWPELRAGAVEQVLALARRLARVVVVDCGFGIEDDEELSYDTLAPRRNAATLTALAEADDLLVVGTGDPVGLQRLVRAVQDLGSIPAPRPRVVVNKVRATAVGSAPERRIAEVLERFAGLEDLSWVPFDPGTLDGAMLHGRALVEHAPAAAVRAALRAVAGPLLPGPVEAHRPGRLRSRRASATMSPWLTG